MSAVPHLDCPECGESLFPATQRGRFDDDGNVITHRAECRCRWCQWIWFDDVPPVTCSCGAVVGIDCEDGGAVSKLISPCPNVKPMTACTAATETP